LLLTMSQVNAQLNLAPITQLLTDSIASIGQLGQNAGFIIIRNDTIIYQQYWGTWNNNTYQPIASGSKLPSMALLMKLIDEGYLSPTDTVQNYLPSFSGKPIMTLHQLMSHTSGLPEQSSYISDNSITLEQAVNNIGTSTPMTTYAPGTAFQYGGVSMHVAGRMAEIATGTRWDTLFQQKIGIALGLSNTDYVALGNTTNFRIAGGMGTTMPDFAKVVNMLLKYGKHNNNQIVDSLTVKMMQSDQTNGVPLIGTPYSGDSLRQNFRYGYGVWLEEETNGQITQFGSQGAFGFTPWIDRCRNIVCVLFVRKNVSSIQPTHTELRNLIEQLIPIKLEKPIITANGNQLQSSYQQGNQWYFNDTLLQGETNQIITPTQNGNYAVKYISPEGCEVFSDEFNYAVTSVEFVGSQSEISIYPNPAPNLFKVNTHRDSPSTIEVYDITGRKIQYKSFSKNTSIDISEQSKGVYFIRVNIDNLTYITKVIKQ